MENKNQPVVIDNETGFILNEADEEKSADKAAEDLFSNEDDAKKTSGVIASFVHSYTENKDELPIAVWLDKEFSKYPDIWQDETERHETTLTVIKTIQDARNTKVELYDHLDKGKSRESWLARKIEQGASSAGVVNVGKYASTIDNALKNANQKMKDCITRQDGKISMAMNLDGFIAEHHHANSFNIDAVAKGSSYRAKVLDLNTKNSVDIGIYDGDGKLVKTYQSKYGANAEKTQELFERGDYSDQEKLVPKGHAQSGSNEIIEIDGVSSKPLSKEEAKALQSKAQREAEAKQYDWNDASRINIAKNIGKQALVAAAFTVGFQGARILGRRIFNSLTGKENQSVNKDLKEFFESSIKGSLNVGVQVAVSGALVVAVKSGWLIKVLGKGTPAGQIANIAYVAMENAKCLYKLAKGEMTTVETLDAMGNTSFAAIGGIAGAAVISGFFAAPIGIFVGAVVGGMAGSAIGEAIYNGSKSIVKTASKVVESIYETAADITHKTWNTVTN